MITAIDLLKRLDEVDTSYTGGVEQISRNRWIIGGGEFFPIQIETLEESHRFIIYGTGVRQTGDPVLVPIMVTQFLENLNGHALGNYGICPGPVTLTVYQVITIKHPYSLDRLAAEIVCHRMLTECFLDADFHPDESWPRTVQDLEDISPIMPFQH